MDKLRYQISIEIGGNLAHQIKVYNEYCREKFRGSYIIDLVQFFPHITLYAPEFPLKNQSKILEKLDLISSNLGEFNVEVLSLICSNGYIMAKVKDDENIRAIHNQVVNELNPLRENLLRDKYLDANFMNKLSIEERDVIEEFGYQYVQKFYKPHFTIMQFDDVDVAQKCFESLQTNTDIRTDIVGKKFIIDNLSIFLADQHAQCGSKIASYKLK